MRRGGGQEGGREGKGGEGKGYEGVDGDGEMRRANEGYGSNAY